MPAMRAVARKKAIRNMHSEWFGFELIVDTILPVKKPNNLSL